MRALAAFAAAFGLGLSTAGADIVSDFSQVERTWGAEISPDGSKVAFGCVYQERRAICVSGLDEASSTVMPAPGNADIKDYYWANSRHVIVVADFVERESFSSGAEDVRFIRAISFDSATGQSVLLMRNIARTTSNTGYVSSLLVDDDERIQMGGYKVNLESGQARVDGRFSGFTSAVVLDAFGDEIVRVKHDDRKGEYELRDPNNRLIYESEDAQFAPFYVRAASNDGESVIIYGEGSNGEIGRGLRRLSLEDGSISRIMVDGRDMSDNSPIIDRHTGQVVGYNYRNRATGRHQLFVDEELSGRLALIARSLDGANVRLTSWSSDRSRIVFAAGRAGEPDVYYLFEADPLSIGLLGEAYPALAERALGRVEYVSYEARDGLEIPSYLTLPPGRTRADGPFPLVLMPHGGPAAFDDISYDWWAQAYAAAGYAVLQPNFRGSSGFGYEFQAAGFGEFGDKMITDVIDGAIWLEAEGVAAPGGACIAGASYGGYAALMAPLHDSNRVRCAVSVNGVTDPFALMGQVVRFAGGQNQFVAYWERYMGDRYASDDAHTAITPLDRVGEYSVPVMLIHGDEDTRVPYSHGDQFRSQARDRSWFEFVRMRGEDHFLMTETSRQIVLGETLEFLAQNHPAAQGANN